MQYTRDHISLFFVCFISEIAISLPQNFFEISGGFFDQTFRVTSKQEVQMQKQSDSKNIYNECK